ncbi:hypothetical protein Pmani_006849 [Petrolisthes manimaculis]|uniref:Uncharacterized protein n=1 Tax=Petrolisthes manimaculis TaxID=1843537 RepID=A0AAE1QA47_9EUCA|nr:hypothetical protein Pmani_006849 [Petrolisthes manimaculis]
MRRGEEGKRKKTFEDKVGLERRGKCENEREEKEEKYMKGWREGIQREKGGREERKGRRKRRGWRKRRGRRKGREEKGGREKRKEEEKRKKEERNKPR